MKKNVIRSLMIVSLVLVCSTSVSVADEELSEFGRRSTFNYEITDSDSPGEMASIDITVDEKIEGLKILYSIVGTNFVGDKRYESGSDIFNGSEQLVLTDEELLIHAGRILGFKGGYFISPFGCPSTFIYDTDTVYTKLSYNNLGVLIEGKFSVEETEGHWGTFYFTLTSSDLKDPDSIAGYPHIFLMVGAVVLGLFKNTKRAKKSTN